MRFLNTILLVLILLVAGGSAYYYFVMNKPAVVQAPQPAQPIVEAPIFLALDPFTVTIRGDRNSQIFYTEITLRLLNTESHTVLGQYKPEVRNRVLAELAQYSASRLQSAEGRTELANRLKEILSAPYHPHLNSPKISNVLFTAFVIQ